MQNILTTDTNNIQKFDYIIFKIVNYINSLSANVENTLHDDDITCSGYTDKIIKNGVSVFERGENWLQNGILHFTFTFSQPSEIVLQS